MESTLTVKDLFYIIHILYLPNFIFLNKNVNFQAFIMLNAYFSFE